ncbi:MAG: amino acid adenylation domain-containing protein [Negativicutes bacterium]
MNMSYQLSQAQQRILHNELRYPKTPINNLAVVYWFEKPYDEATLREALNVLYKVSDNLRLRIKLDNGEYSQYLDESGTCDVAVIDETQFQTDARIIACQPLKFCDSALFQFILLQAEPGKITGIFMKMHHIISDGWTFQLLSERMLEIYNELVSGVAASVITAAFESVAGSYLETLAVEREYLQAAEYQNDKAWWLDKFSEMPEPTTLAMNPCKNDSIAIMRALFALDDDLFQQMRSFCREHKTTIFQLLLSTVAVYIARASNATRSIMTTVHHGRLSKTARNTAGMFVNTIGLNVDCAGQKSFADLLTLENHELHEIFKSRQRFPYNALINELENQHRLSGDISTINVVQIPPSRNAWRAEWVNIDCDSSPLTLYIDPNANERFGLLEIAIDYQTANFSKAEIESLFKRLMVVLKSAISRPESALNKIALMDEAEFELVRYKFNATATNYDSSLTLTDLWTAQVSDKPEKNAVVFKNRALTFAQTDRFAHTLGKLLRACGVKRDELVGILSERSLEMLPAALAVIVAGGAYLPVDPNYPDDRIQYMLADSQAKVLLCQKNLLGKVGDYSGVIIFLDDIEKLIVDAAAEDFTLVFNDEYCRNFSAASDWVVASVEPQSKPDDLIYMIYTSGSTGKPKGVMITHRNLVNICLWHHDFHSVTGNDNTAFYSSFGFDASVWEIFPFLSAGVTVHVIADDIRLSPLAVNEYFNDHDITIANLPTQFCEQFMELCENRSLRRMVTGGDKLNAFHKMPYSLVNEYGPTEYTISATAFEVEGNVTNIPIGKPLANTECYIVDKYNNLLPVGIPGELCISGRQLARGYWQRPELTAEKFVDNPFVDLQHAMQNVQSQKRIADFSKMYRTGDRVRWLPDGNIEFLGRIDFQVKIRGYRIELGEIEQALYKNVAVKTASVLDITDGSGEKTLCAFVVLESGDVSEQQLKNHLSELLPTYMVPEYFVFLPELPLTANGKIDRRALPQPQFTAKEKAVYTEPRTETERTLVQLWQLILNIERIGIDDNFFLLGGNSLRAGIMQARIQKALSVRVSLPDIFKYPTIRLLSENVSFAAGQAFVSIEPTAATDSCQLSEAQRGMFALAQLGDVGTAYNISIAYKITGEFSVERFESAVKTMIQRHEILRTIFVADDDMAVQKILPAAQVSFQLQILPAVELISLLPELAERFVRPFDLSVAPLFRMGLAEVADGSKILLVDFNHIIMDGSSLAVFWDELDELYRGNSLVAPYLQYRDYTVWSATQAAALARQEQYWLEQFSGELTSLNLPYDFPRPDTQRFEGAREFFELPAELLTDLKRVAADNGVSLFMLILAAYKTLLFRYSGQADITVGSVVSGRTHIDTQSMLGIFVNTLALRSFPDSNISFRDYMHAIAGLVMAANDNQDYPFSELAQKTAAQRDTSRNPLFDVMLVLQNTDSVDPVIDGAQVEMLNLNSAYSQVDMTLEMEEQKNGCLSGLIEYSTWLFKPATIRRMINHLENILKDIVTCPDKKLTDIVMLSPDERDLLLNTYNATDMEVFPEITVPQRFVAIAEKFSDKTALVYADKRWSYSALNEATDWLAVELSATVAVEDIVAVMLERSDNIVVAELAVLKAGAAFLPVDPQYPVDRIEYMLEDSAAKLLLTERACAGKIAGYEGAIVYIDDIDWSSNAKASSATVRNLSGKLTGDSLAYIIYTSGSTGKPKGVMLEHRNLLNLCAWVKQYHSVSENDCSATFSGFGFDASLWEMYPYLLAGAELHVVPETMKLSLTELDDYFTENSISIVNLPTQICEQYVEQFPESSLRTLVTGGDKLRTYFDRPYRLVNEYGPTEFTVSATAFTVDYYYDNIPIGTPLGNCKAYVLDKNNQLTPPGVPGELCLAGAQLARGYLNRPDLTAEKFVDNPFGNVQNVTHNMYYSDFTKMYRTGDLVRWNDAGQLEYLGRVDMQVKIRGYRIELGEIEQQILKHPAIKDVAVFAVDGSGGSKYLCAWYVTTQTVTTEQIVEALTVDLPEYMIPSAWVELAGIPLNANGKVDRRALPLPEIRVEEVEYREPQSEQEQIVAEIWQDVLSCTAVGRFANFLQMGGDSIKAIQVVSRLKRKGYVAEVKWLLKKPVLCDFAATIASSNVVEQHHPVSGEVALSPIQKWFFEQNIPNRNHWNQSALYKAWENLDSVLVAQTLKHITDQHDILRAVYEFEGQNVQQRNRSIGEGSQYVLQQFTCSSGDSETLRLEIIRYANVLQSSIDIETGPLLHCALFNTFEGDYLALIIHHLVIDSVSWSIINDDFIDIYKLLKTGQKLPTLRSCSFQKWSKAMNGYAQSAKLLAEKSYWKTIDAVKLTKLPVLTDTPVSNYVADLVESELVVEKDITAALLKDCHGAYRTETEELLLSGFARALTGWSTGTITTTALTLETHGRQDIGLELDINRTVGWFTAAYPLVLQTHSDVGEHIKRVKDTIRAVPNHGIGYDVLHELTDPEFASDLSPRLPVEIEFNYFGEESIDQPDNNAVLTLADTTVGEDISLSVPNDYRWYVSLSLQNGEFRVKISYNKQLFAQTEINRFLDEYRRALAEIVQHCVNREPEFTTSDFGSTKITIADLAVVTTKYGSNIADIFDLSPMQQGMLFVASQDSRAYFEQSVFEVQGEINIEEYHKHYATIINNYDALRTAFVSDGVSRTWQVVLKALDCSNTLTWHDWRQISPDEVAVATEQLCIREQNRGFDLTRPPLLRLSFARTADKCWRVILSTHHIIIDGWSHGILTQELFDNYFKPDIERSDIQPVSYRIFIDWLGQQNAVAAKKYWREYLSGCDELTLIPAQNDARNASAEFSERLFCFGHERTAMLAQIASDHQVTLGTVLQAMWALLLMRYNNRPDVVFGYVDSGRRPEIDGIERMVGLTINTIPVRVQATEKQTFSELMANIQYSMLVSNSYSWLSLADIQAQSYLKNALISHLVAFQNMPEEDENPQADYRVEEIDGYDRTNFDFGVIISPGREINIGINFNQLLYSEEFIEKLGGHWLNLADAVCANPGCCIGELNILAPNEADVIINNSFGDKLAYEGQLTVVDLLDDCRDRYSDRSAVYAEDGCLNYREFVARTDKLAALLLDCGLRTEQPVGVMVGRNSNIIVAAFAAMRAQGAYLPIDPNYPQNRIDYILEDSSAQVLLTERALLEKAGGFAGQIIILDDVDWNAELTPANPLLARRPLPQNLAYIIYTSGSTGKPKGVMIEHRSLMNIVNWVWNYYALADNDKIAAYSGFSFDASIWELFPFILRGTTLHIIPSAIRLSVEQVNAYFEQHQITITDLPTQFCEHFMENVSNKSLRSVTTGGDKLRTWRSHEYQLVNEYGPTEFTISATAFKVDGLYQNIPIGKPLANSACYIVDRWGNLQPDGVPGELCLAGVQIARGYLNQPELTAEKFIANPFVTAAFNPSFSAFAKMYRTGDLVRRLPNNNIEFLGRVDQQVKIRGYRIELGEIEQQLLKCSGVKDAVVIAAEDSRSDKYLAAYFVSDRVLSADGLRDELAHELSDYMIPAVFMQVEVIPLTANGKIDKQALPKPVQVSTDAFVAPETDMENTLVKIWQDLLDLETISVTDNFLKLGGHSLKLVTLAGRIHQEFAVEIPFADIYAHPTVRQLAGLIVEKLIDTTPELPIVMVEDREYYPLSPAQNRMFVLNNMDGIGSAYHVPLVFIIEGELNRDRFGKAIETMINRHESLRTTFELRSGVPVQLIHEKIKFKRTLREQTDDSAASIQRIIDEFDEEIKLSEAPLFKVELVRFSREKHLFLFTVHHIVFDGISAEVFMRELIQLYNGEKLEQPTVRYRDYVLWQQNSLSSLRYEKMKQYWLKMFANDLPVLNLPTDYARPPLRSYEGATYEFELPRALCEKIKALGLRTNTTMFMVFLSVYYILLSKYSGQEDIIIGTPSSGRARYELEAVIGMFVSTLPLRAQPFGEKTWLQFIDEIAALSMSAVDNQDYPLEEIISHLGLKRDSSRNPLFDVMFSFGQWDSADELGGLKITPWEGESASTQFDLTLEVGVDADAMFLAIEYCSKLFSSATIERMAGHITQILKAITAAPDIKIGDIDILTNDEREILVNSFNASKLSYPRNKTIVQMFAEQVRKNPDKPALVYNDKVYSYLRLDETANRLAALLIDKSVAVEEVVAIMVNRSEDIIICGLAALKAGAAFLPIDANYPEDRVRYLLEDSHAKVLLTHSDLLIKSEGFSGEIIAVDNPEINIQLALFPASAPSVEIKPDNLAYIIYTSGSTGRPKGVLLEHRNLINLCAWVQHYHHIDAEDRSATYSGFGFDASIWEMYPFLLYGNTVYIVPDELRLLPVELGNYLDANKITIINLPTQFCEQFMALSDNKSLKTLVTGGDKLRQYIRKDYRLVNEYGPTEYTVSATAFPVDQYYDNIPIGKPLANTALYVIDRYGKLVPVGVPGELCISGAQLARGYLNRPELTAEKFVLNPFTSGDTLSNVQRADLAVEHSQFAIQNSDYKKMYKTGDLVRWLPSGDIEFLGRIDSQVKIRGYRIELGEIEQQLLKINSIKDAFVIDMERSGSERFLVAYVVMQPGSGYEEADIKKQLAAELPDYMVPAYFVVMDSIPLTANGKIDKRALPQPELGERNEYVAPSTDAELDIAKVWKDVLGIEEVGINDNFFNLGGNSIKAISVMAKLNTRFIVTINDIFLHQTLGELAKAVKPAANNLVVALLKLKEQLVSSDKTEEKAQSKAFVAKQQLYETQIEALETLDLSEKFTWRSVLLTGATGFLGAHLLKNIVDNSNADIVVIVRGESVAVATARVKNKLSWYFGADSADEIMKRVSVLCGNLEQPEFGLSKSNYLALRKSTDCIFHTAANVRHFGMYEEFYNSNVQAVLELIKFAGTEIALQHISTVSVAEGTVSGLDNMLFTEFDLDIGQKHDNVYLETKMLAEKEIQLARGNGLRANIFRVGNIVVDSHTGIGQENIDENAFFSKLRAYANIGAAPREMAMEEFSYVDCLANAIRLIAETTVLANANYHLSNPNWVDMAELLSDEQLDLNVKALSGSDFIDHLMKHFDKPGFRVHIENILTHMDLLASGENATVEVAGDWSVAVLARLGFSWPQPDANDMRLMVAAALRERAQFLLGITLLNGSTEAAAELARISEMRLYANKRDVVWEGEANDYFYLVMDGFASLSRRSAGGWSGTVGMLRRQDFFGLESVLESAKAGYTIEAELGELLTLAIPAKRMRMLVESNPRIALALLKSLQQRNEQYMRLLVNLS